MNLYLDTTDEFATACCTLLKTADQHGLLCADLLEAGKGKQDFDQRTRAWLERLPVWEDATEVRAAMSAESAAILDTGRAYYRLLADVAQGIAEGLVGANLLARIQPHFPGIDLAALSIKVLADEAAYQKASSRRMARIFASLSKDTDDSEDEPAPPAPLKLINPEDSLEMRAAALIWQLQYALGETSTQPSRFMGWDVDKQPGPITRFIEEYCVFDTPQDLPRLIACQHEAAERGLDVKLALLQETIAGIVAVRYRGALAQMSASFDGDLPGLQVARWMYDDYPTDPAKTLRLEGAAGSQEWRIACAGDNALITETDAVALLAALEQHLHHELSKQESSLIDEFVLYLNALTDLEDRAFQYYLRDSQSVTLGLMLSCLPRDIDAGEVHPFHDKVGRNMSKCAWEMLEDDVAGLGEAELDEFELAEVLVVLRKIQPDLLTPKQQPSFIQRMLGKVDQKTPLSLALPDCTVSQNIALVERFPRQVTLAIGAGETAKRWQVNVDKMRLFACQLRHRTALLEGEAAFVRAWLGEWMAELAKRPVVRRQRFLRTLSVADAVLLFSAAPANSRTEWLKACSSAVREQLHGVMSWRLVDEHCDKASRIIFSHRMFAYMPDVNF